MKKSLWIWRTAYALFSAIFWYITGQVISLVPPMMLDDAEAVQIALLKLGTILLIYGAFSLLFFRALSRSRVG